MDRLIHINSHLAYNLKLGNIHNYNGQFDLKKHVLVISPFLSNDDMKIIVQLLDKGAKFIFDHLWERPNVPSDKIIEQINPYADNGLALFGYDGTSKWTGKVQFVPMFFWFNEYLHTNSKKVSIQKLPKAHKFLMPVNGYFPSRQMLIKMLGNRLDTALYSIGYENKYLPDCSTEFRAVNLNWYRSTYFSLVVESHQESIRDTFLTEKTFKPIMYGHPFLLYAQPNSLDLLKRNGFKTFPTLFDESYDSTHNLVERIEKLLYNIDIFDPTKIDEELVQHNLNLFYDEYVVMTRITKELLDPIKSFINE